MDTRTYQALVIAKALELYAKTGRSVNRAYTPKAMMRTAAAITGQTFKPRDYLVAAKALRDFVTMQPTDVTELNEYFGL